MTHTPTEHSRSTVLALTGFGVPQEDVAQHLGISDRTLRKHYRPELNRGVATANAKIAESLFKKALGDGQGSVAACIFWLKSRAGWKEKVALEHSNGEGGPFQIVISTDDARL